MQRHVSFRTNTVVLAGFIHTFPNITYSGMFNTFIYIYTHKPIFIQLVTLIAGTDKTTKSVRAVPVLTNIIVFLAFIYVL